jgi:hypothetical protein
MPKHPRTAAAASKDRDEPPRKRSRNSSANSGMSSVSYDSAIGDIYFVSTPHSALDLERELLELTSASCEAAAAALSGAVSPDDGREDQVKLLKYFIFEIFFWYYLFFSLHLFSIYFNCNS